MPVLALDAAIFAPASTPDWPVTGSTRTVRSARATRGLTVAGAGVAAFPVRRRQMSEIVRKTGVNCPPAIEARGMSGLSFKMVVNRKYDLNVFATEHVPHWRS
jgi:hypothetical protein